MKYNLNQLIYPATDKTIDAAASALQAGKLVIIPTETVYGLAADALNAQAAAKIFAAKERPFFDPLICHISNQVMLSKLTPALSPEMKRITDLFWPGPLTIVVEKNALLPDIITSGLSTVAIRMPAHPIALRIIDRAGTPLAAPSANLFGKLSPTRPEHTLELAPHVHSIIDGGPSEVGVESTIIRELKDSIIILRPGKITDKQISQVTKLPVLHLATQNIPDAPGQLPSHYAPRAPITIIKEDEPVTSSINSVLLTFRTDRPDTDFIKRITLSQKGSLTEAASRFFESLHTLDALNPERIYAEAVPERGIGIAIMNRLRKAAYRE